MKKILLPILATLLSIVLLSGAELRLDFHEFTTLSDFNEMFECLNGDFHSLHDFMEIYSLNEEPGKVVLLALDTKGFDESEFEKNLEEAMRRVEEATSRIASETGSTATVRIDLQRGSASSPYIGITTADLTLNDAALRGYNKFYGVLITRVVDNSPARMHRLLPDDILMEIDGQRLSNKSIFSNIVDSYKIGDTVRLKIFRNQSEMEMDFTFGSRHGEPSGTVVHSATPAKKKLPVGSLGGSWIPMYYTPDMKDINQIITSFGFSQLDDDGLFLNGGGGKINVGKGLFLGGMGVGYSLERKTQVDISGDKMTRRMRYGLGFGGVTIEQRLPLSRKLVTSVGAMLGWGRNTLEVSQTDGDYNWGTFSDQFASSRNNYIHLSRSFIMLHPKAEIFYRLNSWLGIRSEVGYALSYSYHSGWNVDDSGEIYEVKNSPNTSFNGLTVSVGPWFGF